jgi:hypothetical protein
MVWYGAIEIRGVRGEVLRAASREGKEPKYMYQDSEM